MNRYAVLASALLVASPTLAVAQNADELARLRAEIEALKSDYEQRLQQLEARLQSAAADPAKAPTVSAPAQAGKRSFNPDVSLILNGMLSHFSRDPEQYALAGFMSGPEAGLGEAGFSVQHSELILSAHVDDLFYGQLTAAIAEHDGETELELEEAYIETLGLGQGLQLRAGRFYSGLGYLNQQHAHAWDFVDAPLVYRALFANQLNDDGVQLSWLAPTDLYLSFGVEALRGADFPAAGGAHNGLGAHTLFAKLGGDVGVEHSWQVGVSHWRADVIDRSGAAHGHGDESAAVTFSGDSQVSGLDVVWKWAPQGNPARTYVKFQAEYFQRDEDGVVTIAEDPVETTSYDGRQRGWYAQSVYQFMPRWRVGLRYDRLVADNTGSDSDVLAEAGLDSAGHDPQRAALMLDYSRSEFSRIRLQYNRDESRPQRDHQLYLQYIMSLGAHGAHTY